MSCTRLVITSVEAPATGAMPRPKPAEIEFGEEMSAADRKTRAKERESGSSKKRKREEATDSSDQVTAARAPPGASTSPLQGTLPASDNQSKRQKKKKKSATAAKVGADADASPSDKPDGPPASPSKGKRRGQLKVGEFSSTEQLVTERRRLRATRTRFITNISRSYSRLCMLWSSAHS